MIVSFLWGVLAFGETPKEIGLTVAGLVVLIFGIVIVAKASDLGSVEDADDGLVDPMPYATDAADAILAGSSHDDVLHQHSIAGTELDDETCSSSTVNEAEKPHLFF